MIWTDNFIVCQRSKSNADKLDTQQPETEQSLSACRQARQERQRLRAGSSGRGWRGRAGRIQ